MKINDAILKRIYEICEQQNKTICEICLNGGSSPSSIYDLEKGRTNYPRIITIARFCDGAGISLSEFFDSILFEGWTEE